MSACKPTCACVVIKRMTQKRKQPDGETEWSSFVRKRAQRHRRNECLALIDVLHKIPTLWTYFDPRSMKNVLRSCKRGLSEENVVPMSLIRTLPLYTQACTQRHRMGSLMRRNTLADKFHKTVLVRHSTDWTFNGRITKHRVTLINALTLLSAQKPSLRADPHYTQHFCIECRRTATTEDLLRRPTEYIRMDVELLSEKFLCRVFFPNVVFRKQLNPRRFSPEVLGFADKPHICRACAEKHDYMEIDAYCSEKRLPYWTFPVEWRREFGAIVSLMPYSSQFHNGRFVPRRALDRASQTFRRFILPRSLCEIPARDLCAWNAPNVSV